MYEKGGLEEEGGREHDVLEDGEGEGEGGAVFEWGKRKKMSCAEDARMWKRLEGELGVKP